ncbi:MAG: diguanylate cyclase [Pseudomonadota bacterium]
MSWRSGFRFSSSALEREYQARLVGEKVRLTRILTLLALLLNVAFAVLDLWAMPSAVAQAWMIRGLMCGALVLTFLSTWSGVFNALYTYVIMFVFSALALGISAIIVLAEESEIAKSVYYGGLLLIIMGVYSLTYVNPYLSGLLSLVVMLGYLVIITAVHGQVGGAEGVLTVAHLYFFVSTALIGMAAQSLRDRYSRENYLLRHSLQRDVEVKDEETRRASYLAEHDPLTGLANRMRFEHDARTMMARTHDSSAGFVVLFIDLDGFKPINDRHGHAVGDRALKVIAERIRRTVRQEDVVARIGGDEFVVGMVVPDGDEHVPNATAERVIAAIGNGIEVRGDQLRVTACVGIAGYPDDGHDLDAVLRAADEQMYRVKKAGKSGIAVTPARDRSTATN